MTPTECPKSPLHPVLQTRFTDPQVGRDLTQRNTALTVLRGANNVVTERLRIALAHDVHVPSAASECHSPDITCSYSGPAPPETIPRSRAGPQIAPLS